MATLNKKQKAWKLIKNYIYIVLGCALLAFGTVVFIEPFELITGGLSSIAILIDHFLPQYHLFDIVIWALQLLLLIIGLIFVGKSFAFRTLYSTLIYVGFLTMW